MTGPAPLIRLPLWFILQNWRPGSQGDDWTWEDEYEDLVTRDCQRTLLLFKAVLEHGFGFADGLAPIKLGNDGRVWNGHHRLIIAMKVQPYDLAVTMAPSVEREHYS